MSSDLKKVNREILEDFIHEYERLPCLWHIKSKEYHDKGKRDAAYNKLLLIYKRIDPSADRYAVIKKINSFRTNYRREKKKVEDSYRSGGTDDMYVPTLWYYPFFSFLEDQEQEMSIHIKNEPNTRPPKRREISDTDTMFENPKKIYDRSSSYDRWGAFGTNVAFKMRDISDSTQRSVAEKLINDALFMAEMGQLTILHSITNIPASHIVHNLNLPDSNVS